MFFPADRHRPYLMTRVQGTNDYINAVFLDVSNCNSVGCIIEVEEIGIANTISGF